MNRRRRVSREASVAGVLVAAWILAGSARGEALGDQFPLGLLRSATKGCTIETRPVSFGTYDPTATGSSSQIGQVIYTCGSNVSRGAVKNIRIEISTGSAGSFNRVMTSGSERLHYNLYLDATHRTVWGDGSAGTDFYFDPKPPEKKAVTVPVYGWIPALQDVAAGQYSDVLQVRILF